MANQQDLKKRLPMFAASDPDALAKEKAQLVELDKKGILTRWKGYFAKTGPGWMQSAMTLGGGSAFASLYAGAMMGYDLLWVQPVAMLLGIIMLSALSHQTLSTGERPFLAMKKFIHPAMAWAWAILSLAATIIWHFPQYALSSAMMNDIIKALTGWEQSSGTETAVMLGLGVLILIFATIVSWNYSKGRKGIKLFERFLKAMIWMIIAAFAFVIIFQTVKGKVDWGKVMKGFFGFHVPTSGKGLDIMMAAFAAAVGINMTFLFGYSYLARGWSKEHRGLAKFDLMTGMLIPYIICTALLVIAAGCTIYGTEAAEGLSRLSPVQAAKMFQAAGIPQVVSRLIFGFGIIGMTLNCIILHMLVSGFAACEIFGIEPGGWKYKLACLIPAPGLLGVILWSKMGSWIAIPTSIACGIMLPLAYIGFFLLNNSKKYLGSDKPTGGKAIFWNIAMGIAIIVSVGAVVFYLSKKFG